MKSGGTEKTLEVFKKLGNYINAHMDDFRWIKLIHNTKLLADNCKESMKYRMEGFESLRLRIS